MRQACVLSLLAGILTVAPASVFAQTSSPATAQIVVAGLTEPVAIASPPGDASRLYVLEKRGKVRLVRVSTSSSGDRTYTLDPTPALDISANVYYPGNRGLIGIAFPPNYASSRQVYLFYTSQETGTDQGRIVRFTQSGANADYFDPASKFVVFSADAGAYHHGGSIVFGSDNYLYFAKGDEGNLGILLARNPGNFFGKLLRFDVLSGADDYPNDPNRNYTIPPTNPFATTAGGEREVWCTGLRSPWQLTIDHLNGDLYTGDVGENTWEEIDRFPAGVPNLDYGWVNFEGYADGPFGRLGADPSRVTFPVYAFPHSVMDGFTQNMTGCAVVAGMRYRGSAIRAWYGKLLFSDLCRSRLFVADLNESTNRLEGVTDVTDQVAQPIGPNVPAFGGIVCINQDAAGEPYILDINRGTIHHLTSTGTGPIADIGSTGGVYGPDGRVDNNDWIVFTNFFFEADTRADIGVTGGQFGSDGCFDNNDFVVFVDAFFASAQQP